MINLKKYRLNPGLQPLTAILFIALLAQVTSADARQTGKNANHLIAPKLALAKTYQRQEDLSAYWVSEKLDGVRAYWNGKQLLSRTGHVYPAPAWFTKDFPAQHLDGELWIDRGQFERLLSTVGKHTSVDAEWKKVKYMVFDLPNTKVPFNKRLQTLRTLLEKPGNPYIHLIRQSRVSNHQNLMHYLDQVVTAHGEGLMLHRGNAFYRTGRTSDLLKVKRLQDAEATVIAHLPGKGKYQNILGALLVETQNRKQFRIGSGFSDAERKKPPPVGSVITYQYTGITKNGIPKFASFLRIRHCNRQLEGC